MVARRFGGSNPRRSAHGDQERSPRRPDLVEARCSRERSSVDVEEAAVRSSRRDFDADRIGTARAMPLVRGPFPIPIDPGVGRAAVESDAEKGTPAPFGFGGRRRRAGSRRPGRIADGQIQMTPEFLAAHPPSPLGNLRNGAGSKLRRNDRCQQYRFRPGRAALIFAAPVADILVCPNCRCALRLSELTDSMRASFRSLRSVGAAEDAALSEFMGLELTPRSRFADTLDIAGASELPHGPSTRTRWRTTSGAREIPARDSNEKGSLQSTAFRPGSTNRSALLPCV